MEYKEEPFIRVTVETEEGTFVFNANVVKEKGEVVASSGTIQMVGGEELESGYDGFGKQDVKVWLLGNVGATIMAQK